MRFNEKIAALGLALLVTGMALFGAVAITATASAQEAGNTLAEETIEVNENTQSVQALAENSTEVLTVTIHGVDADGNETADPVDTGSLDATGNTTATYTYSDLDPENYSSYAVTITGDGASEVDVARVQVQPGGGGGFGGWLAGLGETTIAGIVAAAIVAVLGGAYALERRA